MAHEDADGQPMQAPVAYQSAELVQQAVVIPDVGRACRQHAHKTAAEEGWAALEVRAAGEAGLRGGKGS